MKEDINCLTLEQVLTRLAFKNLEVILSGDGWHGTRYKITTCSYGSAEAKTLEELRVLIIEKWAWMMRAYAPK